MKLEDWRREIDSIDREIVGLIEKRAAVAKRIGALKTAAGLPVTDGAREDEILRNVAAAGRGVLKTEALTAIFRRIIRESRNLQIETKKQNGAQTRTLK